MFAMPDCEINFCDSKGVRCYAHSAQECEIHFIYDSDILCSGEFDRYAMKLHHHYTGGKV